MELFSVENLTFSYPSEEKKALDNISFSINSGEFVLLCGRSGCGKTTLSKLLKKEISPYGKREGKILYKGVEIQNLSDDVSAGEIGFVFQNPDNQIVTDKVWHELAFGLENLGVPSDVIRRRVGEMASYFGIQSWFRKSTDELSGGQKQILNLASVMVMQPQILILDEPTAQLDPIAASDFISVLTKLNREMGVTVFITEQRLGEVLPVPDRVMLMDEGRILMDDTPRNIVKNLGEDNPMFLAMPAAVQIYHGIKKLDNQATKEKDPSNEKDANETSENKEDVTTVLKNCPITVREGREFLEKYIDNLKMSTEGMSDENEHRESDLCKLTSKKLGTIDQITGIDKKSKSTVISLKDVWFRFEKSGTDILRGLNLDVYEGETLCILGANGAGKTTALEVMAGLRKAYRGKIKVAGKNIQEYKGNSLHKNLLALLPQDPTSVFVKDTVRGELLEVLENKDVVKESTKKKTEEEVNSSLTVNMESRIMQLAKKLHITHLLDRHPYDLSGGEQQRCALAKILLTKPKILLLDEPTKGLDAAFKHELINILKALKSERITLIIVTHDLEFAAEAADRCALLFDGEIISAGPAREFFVNNSFYTTSTNRIARRVFPEAIVPEDVLKCTENNK